MTTNQVFKGTLPFVVAKLALGLITLGASLLILLFLFIISNLIHNFDLMIIFCIIWLFATAAIYYVLDHYIGYLVKVGHVAVITEAITTGAIPANQITYGKEKVKERFVTANVYFVIDKLVSKAVRQIQKVTGKIGDVLDNVPGIEKFISIINTFINIFLGFIDECCLGYAFYKSDEPVAKVAADGISIYFKNWKELLKGAAKTTVIVVIARAIVFAAFAGFFCLFFAIFHWNLLVAVIIGVFFTMVIDSSIIHSYAMVSIMTSYMQVAPTTELDGTLYDKLCQCSASFRELFEKGKEKITQ